MPRIQQRRDTAVNWTAANPILFDTELGIETDTRKRKEGDGVTAWNDLPYKTESSGGTTDLTAYQTTAQVDEKYQPKTTFKTVNNESITGEGNINISGSGSVWTENYSLEEDGTRILRKVTGYVGGTGTLPTELSANIGKYYAKLGGFTTVKADATDFKGDATAVYTSLGIYKNTEVEKYVVENVPKQVEYSAFGFSFDTQKFDFNVGDVIKVSFKYKPLTTDLSKLEFSITTAEAGRHNNGSGTVTVNSTLVNTEYSQTVTFTITSGFLSSFRDGSEIALSIMAKNLLTIDKWKMEVSELVLSNETKKFKINKVTNLTHSLTFAKKAPFLISGKLFKPTTVDYPYLSPKVDTRKMKGKRILALGDSNTWQDDGISYMNQVQKITGAAVTNVAKSGSSVAGAVSVLTGYSQFDPSAIPSEQDITKFDVVTIMTGTNGGDNDTMTTAYTANTVWDLPKNIGGVDYSSSNIEAFFSDLFRTGKFLDYYSVIVQYIQYYNPTCKIYLIIPLLKSSLPNSENDRRNQLISFGDYYNIEVIDAVGKTQITTKNASQYIPDGVHFNAMGYKIWGEYVGNFINRD